MKKYNPILLTVLIITVIINSMNAQVDIIVNQFPRYYTPLFDDLYITGTFNGWNEKDEGYKLQNNGGNYSITLNLQEGENIEFKFTRGSWERVETQLDGSFLPNRTLTIQNGSSLNIQIDNWEDMLGWHSAVGNTFLLKSDFNIPQLNTTRRIWIYFPQDYFTSTNTYPVLYMQDGQNIFDDVYAAFGEWDVDGELEIRQNQGGNAAIVVAIDNSINRLEEYSPWINQSYGGGDGEAYTDFIVQNLKPFIDSNFRTKSDRMNTGIMGSSMGGLISFYAAMQHQDVFGKAGIFSPSFWFSDTVYSFAQEQGKQQDMKIYFYCGGDEGLTMTDGMQAMYDQMIVSGFTVEELSYNITPGAQHNEFAWKDEFPSAFHWLFDDILNPASSVSNKKGMYFSAENNTVYFGRQVENSTLTISSISGSILGKTTHYSGLGFTPEKLSAGMYFVTLEENGSKETIKIILF